VALGVGVTALVQSLLGGLGLAIAGVPFAPILTALMFMLCLAQLGPALVLVPAVVWLYWSDSTGWGTFLLVWTIFVGTMDNFLRPILIRKGADLPMLLILAGVIGGMLAFGLVGIFVGPVVLAVAYTLFDAWINEVPARGRQGCRDTAAAPGRGGRATTLRSSAPDTDASAIFTPFSRSAECSLESSPPLVGSAPSRLAVMARQPFACASTPVGSGSTTCLSATRSPATVSA
jgi:hypothetical protein